MKQVSQKILQLTVIYETLANFYVNISIPFFMSKILNILSH